MSISKIDEIEEQKKRQGFFSIGINSPASYFAAAIEKEQNGIDDVETVGAATKPNNPTTYKNAENTRQAVETKEQQDQMPNKNEGVQKGLLAQGYFEMLATYNKLRLDLT